MSVALCVFFVGWWFRKDVEPALAKNSPTAAVSMEEIYADWAHEELVQALELRKSVALVRKNALLDQHIAQGDFEERFEPGHTSEAPSSVALGPDAVALRVDTTPATDGRIVRTTIVMRGEDAELDRLVDEIRWLTTRTGLSAEE